MTIIAYVNAKDISVKFNDDRGTIIHHIRYGNFIKGDVKNPYLPYVYNVGFTGVKYQTKVNGKHLKEYRVWMKVLQRCFDEVLKDKHPTYKNVTLCDEWKSYENFVDWCRSQENYDKWNCDERTWNIDKDIIQKGNKLYSPDTCFLVPQYINVLFCKADASRGDYPIGVYWNKSHKKYQAYLNIDGQRVTLGDFDNMIDAFNCYKINKENHIKNVAEKSYELGEITKRCYEAMLNYKVEITD